MFKVRVRKSGITSVGKAPRGRKVVQVGFPAGKADGAVIERGIFNEFGTSRGIPERPFMRNAMRDNKAKYTAGMAKSAKSILEASVKGGAGAGSKALRQTLSKLGIAAQADIQGSITSLMSPPNAPSTIRQKGSSKPLVDSGAMRQAVTWKIPDE